MPPQSMVGMNVFVGMKMAGSSGIVEKTGIRLRAIVILTQQNAGQLTQPAGACSPDPDPPG